MTISRSGNCPAAYDALFWFTGSAENCDQRTVFANVDRVDVASLPNDDDTAIINVSRPAACSDSSPAMTGALRVNRLNYVSTGANAGIFAAMVGDASIAISNSKIDSSNCFTLFGKSVASVVMRNNTCKFSDYAVSASIDTNEQTQFSLQDNVFEATGAIANTAVDLSASNGSHTVTGNKLITKADAGSTAPIGLLGVSDGYVARNTFEGKAVHAVTVGDSTVLTDNSFDLTATDGDISSYVPGCPSGLIIGAQQASFSGTFCSQNDAIIADQK